MLKTVTILSIAVISFMGYAQATPDAKEGFAYVSSGKNTITAKGDKGEVALTYYTKNVGGPKIYATVTLTDLVARESSKGVNIYLEMVSPKNWGESAPTVGKDGHVQRMLLSVDVASKTV